MPEPGATQVNHRSLCTCGQFGFDWPCVPVEASVSSNACIPVDERTSGVAQSSHVAVATGRTRKVPVPGEPNGEVPIWKRNGWPEVAKKRSTDWALPESSSQETGAPGGQVVP